MTELAWITPIILLPGVALLVLSTAARYGQILTELDSLSPELPHAQQCADTILSRARLFRFALTSLYAAIALMVIASLIGGLMSVLGGPAKMAVVILTCVGIFFVLCAVVALSLEARKLLVLFEVRYKYLR